MMKRATRIDQTLSALDEAGVMLWGRQTAPGKQPSGWYYATPEAVRNVTTAGVKHGKATPVEGVFGPFADPGQAVDHASRTLGLCVVVH